MMPMRQEPSSLAPASAKGIVVLLLSLRALVGATSITFPPAEQPTSSPIFGAENTASLFSLPSEVTDNPAWSFRYKPFTGLATASFVYPEVQPSPFSETEWGEVRSFLSANGLTCSPAQSTLSSEEYSALQGEEVLLTFSDTNGLLDRVDIPGMGVLSFGYSCDGDAELAVPFEFDEITNRRYQRLRGRPDVSTEVVCDQNAGGGLPVPQGFGPGISSLELCTQAVESTCALGSSAYQAYSLLAAGQEWQIGLTETSYRRSLRAYVEQLQRTYEQDENLEKENRRMKRVLRIMNERRWQRAERKLERFAINNPTLLPDYNQTVQGFMAAAEAASKQTADIALNIGETLLKSLYRCGEDAGTQICGSLDEGDVICNPDDPVECTEEFFTCFDKEFVDGSESVCCSFPDAVARSSTQIVCGGQAVGKPCFSDRLCSSGYCQDGVCQQRGASDPPAPTACFGDSGCTEEGDICALSEFEYGTSRICCPSQSAEEAEVTDFVLSGDTLAGTFCGQQDVGKLCSSNTLCESGSCVNGVCV